MKNFTKLQHLKNLYVSCQQLPCAKIIDGKAMAAEIHCEIKKEVKKLIDIGFGPPQLRFILLGDDDVNRIYVNLKMKAAKECNICCETICLPENTTQRELLSLIAKMNEDKIIDGIVVQLPVLKHMDERTICNAVNFEKDVDGLHDINMGRTGFDMKGMIPSIALGIYELLKRSGIQTIGKNAVVIGRSKNIGFPISTLLHGDGCKPTRPLDASVTICHQFTPPDELKKFCKSADIIVSAANKPGLITRDMVKPGACIIDAGTTRKQSLLTRRTRPVGDVCFEEVRLLAGYITRVPGGVGPVSVAMLMHNTLTAAQLAHAKMKPIKTFFPEAIVRD